jgi:CRISPR system Cascade subunit CasE
MMYLSRVELDPNDVRAMREVDRILLSIHAMHGLVYSAFPPGHHRIPRTADQGVLFRKEPELRDGRVVVLVQSGLPPDWMQGTAGRVLRWHPPAVREVDFQPAAGDRFRFRIRANPTRREPGRGERDPKTGKPRDGRRVSVANCGPRKEKARHTLTAEDGREPTSSEIRHWLFRDWLRERLEDAGSTLSGCSVVDEGLLHDRRHGLQFQSALFEGVLQVEKPERLIPALQSGIGSAKGFGFGLLSLAPVR